MNKVVRVHCGNGKVAGKARQYSYYIASLFKERETKDGRTIYQNTGTYVGPFRSISKTEKLGRQLARKEGCDFMDGYGSLHNKNTTNLKGDAKRV